MESRPSADVYRACFRNRSHGSMPALPSDKMLPQCEPCEQSRDEEALDGKAVE
jgi:hypothetical protein